MADIDAVRKICGGMMPAAVYERIYREALAAPQGHFVEIGTGHGAGTVCLALAARDRGFGERVVTVDRMEGGSRARYGDARRNSQITVENFRRFDVEDRVTLVVGDATDVRKALSLGEPIGVLLIDADGRIDREIAAFYEDLVPDALVVIDDCNDLVKLQWTDWRTVRIGSKHKLTFELFKRFVDEGLFRDPAWVSNTVFCRRTRGARLPDDFNQKAIEAYRQIVFTHARLPEGIPGLPFVRKTPAVVRFGRTPAFQRIARGMRWLRQSKER